MTSWLMATETTSITIICNCGTTAISDTDHEAAGDTLEMKMPSTRLDKYPKQH